MITPRILMLLKFLINIMGSIRIHAKVNTVRDIGLLYSEDTISLISSFIITSRLSKSSLIRLKLTHKYNRHHAVYNDLQKCDEQHSSTTSSEKVNKLLERFQIHHYTGFNQEIAGYHARYVIESQHTNCYKRDINLPI